MLRGRADPAADKGVRMSSKPVYLLADSQLLFWSSEDESFLGSVRTQIDAKNPSVAYLGASNGDAPEFFELFCAAVDAVGLARCRMIPTEPSADDRRYLKQADLICLAGGDVHRGWRAFERADIVDLLRSRFMDGAVMMGVSAGAIQLGMCGMRSTGDAEHTIFETLKLVPALVGVHEEDEWAELKTLTSAYRPRTRGLGIPRGGGLIYHPDQHFEPIREIVYEVVPGTNGQQTLSLLVPGDGSEEPEETVKPPLEPEIIIPPDMLN